MLGVAVRIEHVEVCVEIGENLRGDNLASVHDPLSFLDHSEGTVDGEKFLFEKLHVDCRVGHYVGG